jgi:hypothetical protein
MAKARWATHAPTARSLYAIRFAHPQKRRDLQRAYTRYRPSFANVQQTATPQRGGATMRITPSPSPAQGPQQLSRTERLARALIADRNREAASRADISECFVCGHGMLCRGSRFCSDRCREFYDTGAPGHFQHWRQPRVVYRDSAGREMKLTTSGFLIACAHRRKEFDSRDTAVARPSVSAPIANVRTISRS